MESLYDDKDIPFVFKNGLQTLWLSYLTNYVVTQNVSLAQYFKKFEKEKVGTVTEEKRLINEFIANLRKKKSIVIEN